MKQIITLFIFLSGILTIYAQTWDVTDFSQYPAEAKFTGTYPEQATDSGFPEFSWDRIPRWVAARSTIAFTDEQINSIANNYQLVMLEKANQQGFSTIDEGIINASTRLKAVNPNIKTLFYWNSQLGYTGYASDSMYLANAWDWTQHTTDEDGNEILFLHKGYIYWYNFEVEAMREWWLAEALKMARHPMIDGVFLDKCFGPNISLYDENDYPVDNYADMLIKLNDSVPEGKMIIGNTLRNERDNGSRALMEVLDGSYLERWKMFNRNYPSRQSEADAIAVSMQLMREALLKGKIITLQTSPESDDETMPTTYEEKQVYTQNNVYFPLAVFLIVAEENAYFSITTGVNAHPTASTEVWDASFIKEFGYKLGPPLSDPVKNGYEYSRSYENLDVWVNIETKETRFEWKELPPIPTVIVPSKNLALSGIATHSSPESPGEASRAIDGDTNGSYSAGSTSWTTSAANAWWQVELDDTYMIDEITIFGRTDECCKDRTKNFTVSVLDANDSVTYSESFESYPDPSVSFFANGVEGKTIKIQLNESGPIFLAEVQVYSPRDTLRLLVKDAITEQNLSDVEISFDDSSYFFDQAGEISFLMTTGVYTFTFTKQGYNTITQEINFAKDSTLIINMSEEPPFKCSFQVIDSKSKEILPNVLMHINGNDYTTDDEGVVAIELNRGTYECSLNKDGYISTNQSIVVSEDTSIILELIKETYNLKLQIKSAETLVNLQGAMVTVNDSVYEANNQGVVSLVLDYGEYIYTVYKEGYTAIKDSLVLNSDIDKIILLNSSISRMQESSVDEIEICSNPIDGNYIKVKSQLNRLIDYRIFSIAGELKASDKIDSGINTIDVSEYTPGIYFIKFEDDNNMIIKKIIIE